MTEEQRRRGRKLVLGGTLSATLICLCLNLLWFQGPYFMLEWTLILATFISSFITLTIGWWLYCKKRENKKRGGIYGVLAGFIILIIIALVFNFTSYFTLLQDCKREDFSSSMCGEPWFYPLISLPFMFFILLIFGGFLTPIIGGFVGYKIAKPDSG